MRDNLTTGRPNVLFAPLFFLLAILLLSLSPTCVQSSPEADNTDHKLPETVTLVVGYSSIFSRYHGYRDEGLTSWRDANATVGQIGGWRFYAEEAAQSDQDSVIPPQPLQSPVFEEVDKHTVHEGKP